MTELCCVSPSRGGLVHHQGTGASLGHPAHEGSTFDLGLAFGYGPTLRHLAQCHRASHRDSTGGLLPHRYRRKPPHIYSDEEIEKLLRRTQQLPSPKGLRARTYTTLFGLLVATGMRVNEALSLDRPDVDLDLGTLYIRRTKFGKSRYVPVHPSTVEALKKYAEARDRIFPAPLTPAFFLSERGRRITDVDGAIHLRQAVPTSRPPRTRQGSRPRSPAA